MTARQRAVVAMMDGLGMDYFERSRVPFIRRMASEGLFSRVSGVFPSVTNANNASIATGAWPAEHGICANSVYDRERGRAEYLNDAEAVAARTVFEATAARGDRSALLTCKRKTKELLGSRADLAIAAESLSPEEEEIYGPAPSVYSREVNYWLWEAARKILGQCPRYGLVYVHTTDFPMHSWGPDDPESIEHLSRIDDIMRATSEENPDLAFFLTADHGMNAKTRAWDLAKACAARGAPIEFALSPERDYYDRHHRNLTGCSWVWLRREEDRRRVAGVIRGLEGVEAVDDAAAVAAERRVDPARLGDLVVFGDETTMFGDLDSEREELPAGYRAHGSLYEMDLPLVIYNFAGALLPADRFKRNKDLCSPLLRD
jgi:phosphonoacetate hydrolase